MQLMPGGRGGLHHFEQLRLVARVSSVSSSYALSKWSSIARLLRPVMKIMSVMPAAAASSTAYWISGLSTIGSISLGLALVTGRKRLPRPATGNTTLVTFFIVTRGSTSLVTSSVCGPCDRGSSMPSSRPWRACCPRLRRRPRRSRFLRDAAGDLAARLLDQVLGVVAAQPRQRSGQHEREAGKPSGPRCGASLGPRYARGAQLVDHLAVVRLRRRTARSTPPAPGRRRALRAASLRRRPSAHRDCRNAARGPWPWFRRHAGCRARR